MNLFPIVGPETDGVSFKGIGGFVISREDQSFQWLQVVLAWPQFSLFLYHFIDADSLRIFFLFIYDQQFLSMFYQDFFFLYCLFIYLLYLNFNFLNFFLFKQEGSLVQALLFG